jgi:hypothetical protein
MSQQKYTDGSGVAEIWANIKNYITAQLLGKSDTGHTHTKSEITDLPTIPTKTSDLTNDSGFLTSHQDLSGYVPRIDDGYANIAGNGKYSWCKLATITIKDRNVDSPISFEIDGRDRKRSIIQVMFASSLSTTDPPLLSFTSDLDTNFYIKKVDTSIWELYGNYNGNWGWFSLHRVIFSKGISNRVEIDTTLENLSSAPSDSIRVSLNCVPTSGGAVMTGDLLASSTTNSIGFGYGWGKGGTIYTYSPTHSTAEWQGTIRLEPLKTTSYFKTMTLAPDGTWTWNGTACQITSDQRYKQQITEIDDKLLDAWEDVKLSQFKYNDAINEKGNNARLHTGYVVQQIDEACKSHGIDVSAYGLYCHEEYPEETKEVEIEQADGTKTKETKVIREASEHYSLRYTEALIVECKYLRRCIARLTTRIEELEKGNSNK